MSSRISSNNSLCDGTTDDLSLAVDPLVPLVDGWHGIGAVRVGVTPVTIAPLDPKLRLVTPGDPTAVVDRVLLPVEQSTRSLRVVTHHGPTAAAPRDIDSRSLSHLDAPFC